MSDDAHAEPGTVPLAPRTQPARAEGVLSRDHERVRELLYATFRGQPRPILLGSNFGIPGASIWSGARLWVGAFRELGLTPGDRVGLCLPRTPAHVMATIASWWEGLCVCPCAVDSSADIISSRELACRVVVGHGAGCLRPGHDEEPHDLSSVEVDAVPPMRDCAIEFRGERGVEVDPPPARAIRVGYADLLRHLDMHAATPNDDALIAVTPWHSFRGMFIELWPALVQGRTLAVEDVPEIRGADARAA
ncbi:MAG: hypothetical protein SFZ23_03485 [Planctomycetota bacterium]|nr:hypothetical protein [Planctomycetota bacterium]